MRYEALVNDAKIYKGFLPAYLCEIISKQKVVLYGGFDDSSDTNILVSLAAFSLSSQHKDETRLEYIFVAEEKRARGYAGELLSFCTKKMKSAGIRMVNCKLCDEEISLEKLLRKENYIPVSFTGHFLEYALHDFMESKVFGRIPTGQKAGVLTVGKCDEKMMKRFFARADSDKCYMDKNHFDEEYSRFYCEKGEIKACILMEKANAHTLFLSRSYTSADCIQKAAYVFLLADSLKKAGENMPEDTIIQIQTYSKKEYYFLSQINKECKKDYRMEEYVKVTI